MKKKKLMILITSIVVLFSSLIVLFLMNMLNKKEIGIEKADYVIHYYADFYVYDVEIIENTIYVKKSMEIICVTEPCTPIIIDSFKLKYKEEYQRFIESLFKDKNTKEIVITNNDLTKEEIKIMSSIIRENIKNENNITYNIINFN